MFVIEIPGRTELIGNHTDHQGGRVMAATVDLGLRLEFEGRGDSRIRLLSDLIQGELSWPSNRSVPHQSESLLGLSLENGGVGWEGRLTSRLPVGGGLSSSAAFTLLLLAAQERLTGSPMDPIARAQKAREWEIKALGKPCGLMDQLTISVGGALFLDFSADEPTVERLPPAPIPDDWGLYLLNTGMSHEGLTEDYAAIPADMEAFAALQGRERLSAVEPTQLWKQPLSEWTRAGTLPALRALHFFQEEERVLLLRRAWYASDWECYLRVVNESGASSSKLLQNIVPKNGNQQAALLLGILEARRVLRGVPGAERIHGGGFGGLLQVYRPSEEEASLREMAAAWGLELTRVSLK